MPSSTKTKLLKYTAACLAAGALGLGTFAAVLIRFGAYPPDGNGSLGHVGAIIAGVIAAFLALMFSLFAYYSYSKARSSPSAEPSTQR